VAELAPESTPEARDWIEYLAWTRGAHPGQYEATEERAWQRLEDARLRRSVATFELVAPEPEPEPEPGDASPIEEDRRFLGL
jgi:hypothetical protein